MPDATSPPPSQSGQPEDSMVLVATRDLVPLRVTAIEDDRTPDGMACMGTFVHERLIARSVVPPDALAELDERQVFSSPVRLALAAVEEDPGLQCRLFALLPAARFDDDEPDEPWAASVPRFEDAETPAPDPDAVVPVLLGHIVRFRRDRKHPEDLAEEAADVLRTVLADERPLTNVIDRLLDDLLDQ